VQGKTQERWQQLCALAAVEQDGEKLLAISQEIIRLLDEKYERVERSSSEARPKPPR